MAIKFSQFVSGTTIADIDYFVGYQGGQNVQVPSSVVSGGLPDDSVTYAKLGTEFKNIQALSGDAIDWSQATIFTKTISSPTTFTFSNVETGKVIDLIVTGSSAITLPTSVKEISGTYDGTVSNLIQIISTNGSTEQWATISQEA
jgi:hypothetical protein